MKKILFLFSMLFIAGGAFAQAISVTETNPTVTENTSVGPIEVHTGVNVPNGTTLKWVSYDGNFATGWDAQVTVCDDYTCHAPSVMSYTYTTNGSVGLKVSFSNYGYAGTSSIKLALFNPADSAGTVTVITFTATVEVNGVNESKDSKLSMKLFPNPAHSVLYIEMDPISMVDKIEIFNMLGSKVLVSEMNHTFGYNTVDVSSLSQGMYILRAKDIKGNTIKATNFTKK